jgi:homogentisate 1,2-dioxygenase
MPESKYEYLAGFNNHHCSEALPGALPKHQNSPQICPYGLYIEQISGTAFTTPRENNQHAWLYRIQPSVVSQPFEPVPNDKIVSDFSDAIVDPNQFAWQPIPFPEEGTSVDFIDGLVTYAGAGDTTTKNGLAIHMYSANVSMVDKCFNNSDGDFLIVPQVGKLTIQTEFGFLDVSPHEFCVIPRGIRFTVALSEPSRGYVAEVFKAHFTLPQLGPIGGNGLANPRDFLYPTAFFEQRDCNFTVVNKFLGRMFKSVQSFSPYNVVAWHGNYLPFKYDTDLFNGINSVTYDHPDPSIFCHLTCQSDEQGVAVLDFLVMSKRWIVAENTFRPPYYHRNTMSEFVGVIECNHPGMVPGGAYFQNTMTPHGLSGPAFVGASTVPLKNVKSEEIGFMFESAYTLKLTPYAMGCIQLDRNYLREWEHMPCPFDRNKIDITAEDILKSFKK